jgi:multidrug efflux pump subunit AcrA (membrane-fusion protein)
MQFIKNIHQSLITKYGKKRVTLGFVLLLVALIFLGFSFTGDSDVVVEEAPVTAVTRTVSLHKISLTDDGTAVRTADGNAFIVRAESGGRVEQTVKVGDIVARGAIVAQVENSAQRAAVLQAQGAYEAALAGARASDVGSDSADQAYAEAVTQAQNTTRSAFASTDDILRNTVDQVFSQPDTNIPGLKIDGQGRSTELVRERIALETRFDAWRNRLNVATGDDAKGLLEEAVSDTESLNSFVVTLTSLLSDDDALDNTTELESLRSDFAEARTTLTSVLSSLSGARSSLIAAESAKEQAEIAGTSGTVSLGDAQVKQALGVLESARAALNKAAVKTPVAGTVTGVSISVGDIITVGSDVVLVASDAQVETGSTVIVPLTAVKFTPSKAFIFTVEDGKLVAHEVQTGSVTTKSITISGAEGITDIVLDVRGLKEGDQVSYQVES